MSKSPNLGLMVTSVADNPKVKDWRTELCGDLDTSNMMIIDKEVGAVKDKLGSMIIWAAEEPASQADGGTWNEVLS